MLGQRTMQSGNGENYWQAVLKRDAQFESAFVYAVWSTGVYCRPTCASRRPSRDQVAFYASPEAAEQAGFRPCRRCRPRGEAADLPSAQAKLVERLCRESEASLDEGDGATTLATLSQRVGANPYQVHRGFK